MMRRLVIWMYERMRREGEPSPRMKRVGAWMLRNVPGMLTCAEFEDFVHDYYEGLLASAQRLRFDDHMRVCPMCRVHFDSYTKAVALGQQLCDEDDQLPEGMPEELVGAILLNRTGE